MLSHLSGLFRQANAALGLTPETLTVLGVPVETASERQAEALTPILIVPIPVSRGDAFNPSGATFGDWAKNAPAGGAMQFARCGGDSAQGASGKARTPELDQAMDFAARHPEGRKILGDLAAQGTKIENADLDNANGAIAEFDQDTNSIRIDQDYAEQVIAKEGGDAKDLNDLLAVSVLHEGIHALTPGENGLGGAETADSSSAAEEGLADALPSLIVSELNGAPLDGEELAQIFNDQARAQLQNPDFRRNFPLDNGIFDLLRGRGYGAERLEQRLGLA